MIVQRAAFPGTRRGSVEAFNPSLEESLPSQRPRAPNSAIGKVLEEYEKTETSNQYEYRHVKAWSFQLPSSQARDPCNMDRAKLQKLIVISHGPPRATQRSVPWDRHSFVC